jgi:hypothetical protein
VFAAAVLVPAGTVPAQSLSQADRDRGLAYLETTRKAIEDATRGLNEAQWNFKPSPFRWSIAQLVEHITTTEETLRNMIETQVMKAPAAPDRDLKKTDDMVLAMIPDRSRKFEAPQMLRPTNRYGSPQGSLKQFLDTRAKTVALLKNTPDLREHAVDSQLFKKMDAFQWTLFIGAHSERHTKQIVEVKADPNFPK